MCSGSWQGSRSALSRSLSQRVSALLLLLQLRLLMEEPLLLLLLLLRPTEPPRAAFSRLGDTAFLSTAPAVLPAALGSVCAFSPFFVDDDDDAAAAGAVVAAPRFPACCDTGEAEEVNGEDDDVRVSALPVAVALVAPVSPPLSLVCLLVLPGDDVAVLVAAEVRFVPLATSTWMPRRRRGIIPDGAAAAVLSATEEEGELPKERCCCCCLCLCLCRVSLLRTRKCSKGLNGSRGGEAAAVSDVVTPRGVAGAGVDVLAAWRRIVSSASAALSCGVLW